MSNQDLHCRDCGHVKSDHADGRGGCSHVRLEEAIAMGGDIICSCPWFWPRADERPWVLDVYLGGNWSELDLHWWPTREEAEAFAQQEVHGAYGVRRSA